MAETVTIRLKNFRAIKEATIKLNGITVVSGINGSGKSTLSKFLYHTFQIVNSYEKLANQELSRRLVGIYHFLNILRAETIKSEENYRTDRPRKVDLTNKDLLISSFHRICNDYINSFKNNSDAETNLKRIINILQQMLKIKTDESDISMLIKMLEKRIEDIFCAVQEIVDNRPASFLQKELSDCFPGSTLPESFEISEYGDLIVGNKSNSVSIVHSVQRTAYIDTPMTLGRAAGQDYWDDLNDILREKPTKNYNQQIDDIIQSEILQGESGYEVNEFNERFTFSRKNGSTYNLLECATGIKSFSILQFMLRSGFLTPNTLLIIDEPEAHLHPQWIVEYARLIVLLNKHVGVHFFIASHNPDMVSAIKYISEKENITSSLSYYLADRVEEGDFSYTYKDLGTDINPIFKSFNIALDRINLYGTAEEDNDIF
jgi:predicted ATP-dependent endonuclease of OLD family